MVLANFAGTPLTDPRFPPIWQAIDNAALPVLVHPTAPRGSESMSLDAYHLAFSAGFTSTRRSPYRA
jgi:aminocarboxymuconate-semialdehyde decarboxylase